MQTIKLLEHVEFDDNTDHGHAQALFADAGTRVLRFTLKDGQSVKTHHAHSPVVMVVVDGVGRFTGADGQHVQAGANVMLVFSAGEDITVEHVGGDLVFLGLQHGAAGADQEHAAVG